MKNEPSNKEYGKLVEEVTPTHSSIKNCMWAFFVGGAICTIGEVIKKLLMVGLGLSDNDAGGYTVIILVLVSVLLTGLNIYSVIGKYGGAGSLVPITGFANSVAAPAIEFQKEGQVFGIGVKIFTIAGPVILYGIFASFILGIIYYFITLLGGI